MKKVKKKIGLLLEFVRVFWRKNVVKYRYQEHRYVDSFISRYPKRNSVRLEPAPYVIYVFWTGPNDLSLNRTKGLDSLRRKSGARIVLITENNLSDYILPYFPLHKAYEYLSYIQRSDYLRCYFMHHYGGGYSDIKQCLTSWKPLFDELNSSDNWCLGQREKSSGSIANIDGSLGVHCKQYYFNIISNGAFIFKPYSPITDEWMKEIIFRLDNFYEDLKRESPSEYGSISYPIKWAYLAGYILAPLSLKYLEKVLIKDIRLYSSEDYR